VIVTVFDAETLPESMRLAAEIRAAGVRVVVYPDVDKLGKQLKFADKLGIPVAVVLGPDELVQGKVTVKNLKNREQITVEKGSLLEQIENFLPSPD
jgi:histidyl-tRNA synthetase